ncbi:FAD-dependent monooxygenase [Williamsia serinedens]|uniref:2-polyprenyl-6-methoxyphenol hydroxylase n=1 Tax=Williamsia serinedens TaxID=391736 RepID=A0ABT1H7G9_9NOCA|nr:FAD-dependent monooxygenase [Williamsia serinedens]MCP2162864.1 2-polyprenyl-6-methoxyphenol hydroxylase [Williamsia serinedens]
MHVLVVGGGVGGPVLAMALRDRGWDVTVVERTPADGRGSGSWFTVTPNGLSALAAVGALDPVRALGSPTAGNLVLGATGRRLGTIGAGAPLTDGTPALSFRRPELAATLLDLAVRRGVEVVERARVTTASSGPDAATISLDDGTSLSADVVVGADGIQSVVRRAIDPQAPSGRYLGLVNFGGVTVDHADHGLTPGVWTFVFGRRAFFGALPIADGRVVWFANEPRPAVSDHERATTSSDEWRAHLVDLAAADDSPFADLIAVGRLDLAADNTHDLPSVPRWHRGRLGLIGDAIHAPSPSSGQGASMALEDAVIMGDLLDRHADDPASAFSAFDTARRRRVEKIVAMGARSSSAKTPGSMQRVVTEAVMRVVFRFVVTERSQAWVTGYRVEEHLVPTP